MGTSRAAISAIRPGFSGRCWKPLSKVISSPIFRSVIRASTVPIRATICDMRRFFFEGIAHRPLTEGVPKPDDAEIRDVAARLNRVARRRLGHSLSIREVDAGSCNGCELEIQALGNAYYDLERFGLRFVASPRHADVLLVTGPVTKNMQEALKRTYDATPSPKWVVAAGDCAFDGGLFATSYAVAGGVANVVPVDLYIKGCPPRPADLLKGLLTLIEAQNLPSP